MLVVFDSLLAYQPSQETIMKQNKSLIETSLIILPFLGFMIPFAICLFFALVSLLGHSIPAASTWFIQGASMGFKCGLVLLLVGALNVWSKWELPQGTPKYKTMTLFNGVKVKVKK